MNKETLIFWIGEHNSLRGKGGTKGAMAARVVFNTRLEKTIDEFRKYFRNIFQETTMINYMDIIMYVKKCDLEEFANDPVAFTLRNVSERML